MASFGTTDTNPFRERAMPAPLAFNCIKGFTTGLSVLAIFVTTSLAHIVPLDYSTLQADSKAVNNECGVLQAAIEQLKAPLTGNALLNVIAGSTNLCTALNKFANDAEITGTITDEEALSLLASIEISIDNCIIPTLNKLTADGALLANFKVEIEPQLKKLQTCYLSCATNLISACPSAEKPKASQLAAKPNSALAACLKAYA
ncbi:hypothetical protein J3R30DRAFT_1609743 [Lentinula aciculospora]|uniref:Uncharacterized protein n=1 Tax=Lentinula aciculospora TaxID=153920 RepID=A0A9W8ZWH3_9AGAR|nr:hypothetical protein J3R30DRAFT_1609743 [Lentinula aciculospora]